jgi:hypothetical protein
MVIGSALVPIGLLYVFLMFMYHSICVLMQLQMVRLVRGGTFTLGDAHHWRRCFRKLIRVAFIRALD